MTATAIRGFYKLSLSTLIAVYFLILVGGIVRSTGSGMGCPDWPRCFGNWVPPTSVKQLPENYKDTYSALRDKKNQKFARYLRIIGLDETADKILSDKSILKEADFNPVKTWIEYLNRLVGVAIGLFIIALFLRSLKFRKTRLQWFWISLATLIGVIFQGWFGSIVVSTNLTTWTITIHMFLALLIVGLLIYLEATSRLENLSFRFESTAISWLLIGSMILLLTQVFFGTQVREGIDWVAAQMLPRSEWVSNLGLAFIVHRSFSWAVLIIHAFLIIKLLKTTVSKPLIHTLILLILCSLATGIVMAYFSVPAILQPVHLLVATLAFGFQLIIFFRVNTKQLNVLNG